MVSPLTFLSLMTHESGMLDESRKLRKQMKRTVFFVASSDSDDDDEVIFVSQVPPRR